MVITNRRALTRLQVQVLEMELDLDKVEVSAPVKAVDSDLVAAETWAAVTSTLAVADLAVVVVATTRKSSLVRK